MFDSLVDCLKTNIDELNGHEVQISSEFKEHHNKDSKYIIKNWLFSSPEYRKWRITRLDGGIKLQVLNTVAYPNFDSEIPILGADILWFGTSQKLLAILDYQPLIQEGVNNEAENFGIKIVDVRIKRADLPQANSDAIFRRMQTEREREAKEFRAKGAEMAVTITSTADKEVTVILADAQKKSEIMKGEGDGKRNNIFANAFGQDPEFFAFYRAMQAYEKALIGGETSLILSPDSEFFKFFGNIKPNSQ